MKKATIQQLFNAVKCNCFMKSPEKRDYAGPRASPYMPMLAMFYFMKKANYTKKDIQLEMNLNGYTYDKVEQLLEDLDERSFTKIQLVRNFLKLNYNIIL